MGAGTDAAIETADVALMSDDLGRLPWLVRHSRNTLSVIGQNIAFSLAVKLLFVALTFAGYLRTDNASLTLEGVSSVTASPP
jgi:Cd2+/Zn2+-exporting ATPase